MHLFMTHSDSKVDHRMQSRLLPARKAIALTLAALAAACATSQQPIPEPPAAQPPPAPWSQSRLDASETPAVYRAEWSKADNKSTCALIAPRGLGEGKGATPRRANFSGGWAVAYDTPEVRSAFGIAGTGSRATDASYSGWPHARRWADGSVAEYGPEGGSGPNQLAYLRIAGQDCLYNVWSRLGVDHLEHLLEQLRFVR